MKIDRRISNGLAWAGVALVVGVPTADLLSAQFFGDERAAQVAVIEPEDIAGPAVAAPTPVTPPAQVATAAPAKSATASNVVDTFLEGGKALPSYITGGSATAPASAKPQAPLPVSKPAATEQAIMPPSAPQRTPIVTTPAEAPVQVATLPAPVKVAPVPMPLSMRPKPVAPVVPVVADTAPPLILPDRAIPTAPDRVIAATPDRVVAPLPPADVTSADLDDWESGPLSEFLASRQRQQNGSSAEVTYDRNGFVVDDPYGEAPQGNQYIGPVQDDMSFVPFGN